MVETALQLEVLTLPHKINNESVAIVHSNINL